MTALLAALGGALLATVAITWWGWRRVTREAERQAGAEKVTREQQAHLDAVLAVLEQNRGRWDNSHRLTFEALLHQLRPERSVVTECMRAALNRIDELEAAAPRALRAEDVVVVHTKDGNA